MDDTSISAELARAASYGSRELDRTCEQVATTLFEEDTEPPFEVRSADFTADPYLICADRYWRLRFLSQLLCQRAKEAVATYPQDSLFHFRLATGQHMCDQHDAALASIDTALRLLPAIGSRGSHKLLQEQYMNKRDAIQEGRLRAIWAAEQQLRWERQESANTELQQTMQSSAIRAVELVAIFTAAIAFAVGALQITVNGALALRDRIWLLVILGAGLAVFALLIIGGTWLITRTPRQK